jgi:outer membrane protein TolC
MMARKIIFFLMVIVVLSGSAFALTWEEAVMLAGEHSNSIKSAQKQLEAYRWSYYRSYSSFLPQVSASFSIGESTGSSGNSYSDSYGLSVRQSLFSGTTNYYNARSAAVNLDLYTASLQSTMADYYNQVRQSFVDLYMAQQNLEVQKKIRQSRDANFKMIQLLYDGGTEDKGSYLRTQSQLSSADYNIASAMRQLELAQLKLSQLIGSDVSSVEGDLAAVTVVSLPDFESLMKSAPANIINKSQLELADISQKKSLSGFLPTVSLNGSYQNSGDSWPPTNSSKSLSLNVSLPIFPGGSNIADRVIAGLQLEKAKEDFINNQKDLYYSIRQAYNDLRDAIESYNVQKTALIASAERARIAQASYMNGLISYNDWDLIQNDYINNQSSLLNYQRNMLVAEANWYKSYGGWVK